MILTLTENFIKKFGARMKTGKSKKQLGIRIPPELESRLENHVSRIGISKQAFILNLIFKELEKVEKRRAEDDDDD